MLAQFPYVDNRNRSGVILTRPIESSWTYSPGERGQCKPLLLNNPPRVAEFHNRVVSEFGHWNCPKTTIPYDAARGFSG